MSLMARLMPNVRLACGLAIMLQAGLWQPKRLLNVVSAMRLLIIMAEIAHHFWMIAAITTKSGPHISLCVRAHGIGVYRRQPQWLINPLANGVAVTFVLR